MPDARIRSGCHTGMKFTHLGGDYAHLTPSVPTNCSPCTHTLPTRFTLYLVDIFYGTYRIWYFFLDFTGANLLQGPLGEETTQREAKSPWV